MQDLLLCYFLITFEVTYNLHITAAVHMVLFNQLHSACFNSNIKWHGLQRVF